MELSEKFTKIRKAAGLSRGNFGLALEITEGYVGQIERGEKIPHDRTISLLMLKFNVSDEWWKTGEGEMFNAAKKAQKDDPLDLLHKHVDKAWENAKTESEKMQLMSSFFSFIAKLRKDTED